MSNSVKFLTYSILFTGIYSVLRWSALNNTGINSTFFWWAIQILVLYTFYKLRYLGFKDKWLDCYFIYVIISFLYGIHMSENYWHYKSLVQNTMFLLMPLAIYPFESPRLLHAVLSCWFKRGLVVLVCLSPFLYSDAWGNYLAPFCLLALFYKDLPKKWRYLTILAFIIILTLGWASRSSIIRLSAALLIGISFAWKNSRDFILKHLKKIFYIFSILPVIFFVLGVTNVFNIFRIDKELNLSQKYEVFRSDKELSGSKLDDTRTFLYVEVLSSAIKNHYIIQGRSPARGYDTIKFADAIREASGGALSDDERPSSETCILNIFTYMGVIGVILFAMLFLKSAYMSIWYSRNYFVKIIALFVLFRWCYSWIEELTLFSINFLILWVILV